MKRWYVYLPALATAGQTPTQPPNPPPILAGYVENTAYSRNHERFPGALELAKLCFGNSAEVTDGGHVTNPRRSPVAFTRLSNTVFIANHLNPTISSPEGATA